MRLPPQGAHVASFFNGLAIRRLGDSSLLPMLAPVPQVPTGKVAAQTGVWGWGGGRESLLAAV